MAKKSAFIPIADNLIARALATPPPYRPVSGSPIYHLRVGDGATLVAEHDLLGRCWTW